MPLHGLLFGHGVQAPLEVDFFLTTRVINVTDRQAGAEDTPRYTGGIIIEFCLKLTILSAGKVNGNLSAEVTKTVRNSAPSMLNLLHRNGRQRS